MDAIETGEEMTVESNDVYVESDPLRVGVSENGGLYDVPLDVREKWYVSQVVLLFHWILSTMMVFK